MSTQDPEPKPSLSQLLEAREKGSVNLGTFVAHSHPADLADWLEQLEPEDAWSVFEITDPEKQIRVFDFAEEPLLQLLASRIEEARLVEIASHLADDRLADLLAVTDDGQRQAILVHLGRERAAGVRELARYPHDTAGGIMTQEFVTLGMDESVGDAIKKIKSQLGPAAEEEVGVFVVDADERPVGHVTERDLITTKVNSPIAEAMETQIVTVAASEDQEDVAHQLRKYGVSALPVVDEDGRLIGVVSAEDAMDVLEDEAEEDLMRVVGTSPNKQTRLPIFSRVRARIPMQALTVLGGLATAFILDRALPTSHGQNPAADLLRYLPIVIGLAGNVGIQCSTILVRAFATGEVAGQSESQILAGEVLVGVIIGLICGLSTAIVAGFLEYDSGINYVFGLSVGSAICVAVIWAAFLGCLVPITCNRIGVDPAIVAGPFLITLSDISGAAIFVGVAYLLLGLG